MCGRFYIDDETAKEIEKIVRKIDQKMAKLGGCTSFRTCISLEGAKG